ncbi:hypothetical protein HYW46_05510 [Candidatus Daviesbacteria bacterium]|nr:hypothetical protein [Candidatus Daviesbacteria bacterium]
MMEEEPQLKTQRDGVLATVEPPTPEEAEQINKLLFDALEQQLGRPLRTKEEIIKDCISQKRTPPFDQ